MRNLRNFETIHIYKTEVLGGYSPAEFQKNASTHFVPMAMITK